MLKNLVKKFTSHTLNEGDGSDTSLSPADPRSTFVVDANSKSDVTTTSDPGPQCNYSHQHQLRRMPISGATTAIRGAGAGTRACVGMSYAGVKNQRRGRSTATIPPAIGVASDGKHFITGDVNDHRRRHPPSLADSGVATNDDELHASGTESDEELAVIETNSIRSVPVSLTSDYYTSQQSLSASCRSSHCGSPLLDQDCASWDSFGCESGGCVRNNESLADLEVELPNHHYHTRQQFRRFLKYQQQKQISNVGPATIDENSSTNDVLAPQYTNDCSSGGTSDGPNQKMGTRSGLRSLDDNGFGGQNAPTADECAVYNTQLASPSSSVDELESINGSSAPDQANLTKKDKQEIEFVVPDVNVLNRDGNMDRSSFTLCAKQPNFNTAKGGASAAEKRKWSQVQSADFTIPANHRSISGDAGAGVGDSSSLTLNGATSLKVQVIGETGNYINCAAADLSANSTVIGVQSPSSTCGPNVARRAPVRLLIAPTVSAHDAGHEQAGLALSPTVELIVDGVVASSMTSSSGLKSSPRKKCRATAAVPSPTTHTRHQEVEEESTSTASATSLAERQRPSLNFDKMREVCF